jgi:multidrug efflux pump subunit AcrA (membrane-fusion protein)
MKSFFKSNPSWGEIGVYVLIVAVFFGGYFLLSKETTSKTPLAKKEKIYNTTHPQLSQSFSTQKLIGRVRSNNFAMIHPRREGIAKDILVDVGDIVTEGQTIAYLFPPGVEGQSSAQIRKAYAQLVSAQEALTNAQQVSVEMVQTSAKKVEQAQTILDNTQVDEKSETRSQLTQRYDHTQTVTTQSMQNLRRILFGTEQSQQVSATSVVGKFSDALQKQNVFNAYVETEQADQDQLLDYANQVEQLLTEAERLYRTATVSRSHTQTEIESSIATIQADQRNILSAREKLDDTILSAEQLSVSLSQAEQNLDLSQSQAQTSVDNAQNRLDVAQAAYQAVLTQSGHVQIVSPFAGTISQRFIEVGHMVMPSMALFEIVNVDTVLGKETAHEVQFGLPEELIPNVHVGDVIEVSLPYRGQETFRATVTRKSDSLDSSSRTATAHAVLETDQQLSHNASVFVRVTDSDHPAFSVPTTSLKRRGSQYFLWVLDEEAQPRSLEISVLAEDGEWSDVEGNLSLESNLVTNPSVSLFRTSTPLTPTDHD